MDYLKLFITAFVALWLGQALFEQSKELPQAEIERLEDVCTRQRKELVHQNRGLKEAAVLIQQYLVLMEEHRALQTRHKKDLGIICGLKEDVDRVVKEKQRIKLQARVTGVYKLSGAKDDEVRKLKQLLLRKQDAIDEMRHAFRTMKRRIAKLEYENRRLLSKLSKESRRALSPICYEKQTAPTKSYSGEAPSSPIDGLDECHRLYDESHRSSRPQGPSLADELLGGSDSDSDGSDEEKKLFPAAATMVEGHLG